MRFLTAVALATVMLWVPVDASGQEVTKGETPGDRMEGDPGGLVRVGLRI